MIMKRNDDGTFAKGNGGGGRPKGSKNKSTKELRQRVNDLIEMNWHTIEADFKRLRPDERINMIIRLLEFSIPKLQRTNVVDETQKPMQINFVNYADLSEKDKKRIEKET